VGSAMWGLAACAMAEWLCGVGVGPVSYTENWVCDVSPIKYPLSPGKPERGWDSGREGTRGQWGTKGVSLRTTWD
jgi:hypothetical protein